MARERFPIGARMIGNEIGRLKEAVCKVGVHLFLSERPARCAIQVSVILHVGSVVPIRRGSLARVGFEQTLRVSQSRLRLAAEHARDFFAAGFAAHGTQFRASPAGRDFLDNDEMR